MAYNSKYKSSEIEEILDSVSGKQDAIEDLATIREGAAKGATAVQPDDLATVATSGSYDDLTNKPTIPSAVTESTVSGWGFTKNTGTYSKPSTGIPKTDMASAVQTSLGKADSSVQNISMGVTSGNATAGNFFKVNKDANGNVTIQMIQNSLASGKIAIPYTTDVKQYVDNAVANVGGGGGSGGSGAYSEVNHGTSDTTFTLTPNTFHVWDEVASLTLTLGDETSGVANEFLFQFNSGATATTLTLPDTLKWANDSAPTIEANKIYQISILKGLASVLEFKNTGDLIENKLSIISGGMGKSTFTFEYPVASDVTIQYSNTFGGNGTSIIENGTQLAETSFEPGNESITSVVISPSSDNTYIYTT